MTYEVERIGKKWWVMHSHTGMSVAFFDKHEHAQEYASLLNTYSSKLVVEQLRSRND